MENKEIATKKTAITMSLEIREIINKIVEAEGEITAEQEMALNNLHMELGDKAEQIAFVQAEANSQIEYFKQIKAAAEQQIRSREKTVEYLKKYLAKCMKMAGVKSLKKQNGLFSVSLVKSKAKVQIDDVDKLPFDYTEIITTVKPKTAEIKKALEQGNQIDGASLEYGEDYIMIRGGKKNELQ